MGQKKMKEVRGKLRSTELGDLIEDFTGFDQEEERDHVKEQASHYISGYGAKDDDDPHFNSRISMRSGGKQSWKKAGLNGRRYKFGPIGKRTFSKTEDLQAGVVVPPLHFRKNEKKEEEEGNASFKGQTRREHPFAHFTTINNPNW